MGLGLGKFLCFFALSFVFCLNVYAEPSEVKSLVDRWKADRSPSTLVDAFLAIDPDLNDGRELIGQLRLVVPRLYLRDFMKDFTHIWAQRTFDQMDRNANPQLARALRIFWRRYIDTDSEKIFLTLLQFSKQPSSDIDGVLKFYMEEALSLLPPNDSVDVGLDLSNIILIHYTLNLPLIISFSSSESPADWADLINLMEFPGILLTAYANHPPENYESFPFPMGAFEYFRARFFRGYERAIYEVFQNAKTPQDFVLCAKMKFPSTPDLKEWQPKVLIYFAEAFMNANPSFRDFANYVLPLAGGNVEALNEMKSLLRDVNLKTSSVLVGMALFSEALNSAQQVPETLKDSLTQVTSRMIRQGLRSGFSLSHPEALRVLNGLTEQDRAGVRGYFAHFEYQPSLCRKAFQRVSKLTWSMKRN